MSSNLAVQASCIGFTAGLALQARQQVGVAQRRSGVDAGEVGMGQKSCGADYSERARGPHLLEKLDQQVRVSAAESARRCASRARAPAAVKRASALLARRRQRPAHGCARRSASAAAPAAPRACRRSRIGTRVERSMPSARASAIWLRPALRSTSTSRPNFARRQRFASAGKGGGEVGEHRGLGAAQHIAQQRGQHAAIEMAAEVWQVDGP